MKRLVTLICILFISLFCFITPIEAVGEYVRDDYGVLSEQELAQLNEKARMIADEYDCGVYIRVVKNKENYTYIEDYAEYVYNRENLGVGPDRDGVLFIIDMDERYYDITAHGDTANRAFTDFAKSVMEDEVVPVMGSGNFYKAFDSFLNYADYDLEREAAGSPVDINNVHSPEELRTRRRRIAIGATTAVSPLTSLLICLGLRSKHKTKGRKYEAHHYIPKNGIRLNIMNDQFLYRSEQRTPIVRPSSSGGGGGGGTTINSGGFSHSSGKF